MLHKTELMLKRERSPRQTHTKDLNRLKNSMELIMNSNFSMRVKVKLMESVRLLFSNKMNKLNFLDRDAINTKINCTKESNNNAKLRIIRISKVKNYTTPFSIIDNWAKSLKNVSADGNELSINSNSILKFILFIDYFSSKSSEE